MTSEALIEAYGQQYVKYHQISAQRWRTQRNLLTELATTLSGSLADCTYADLMSFVGTKVDAGLHPNTVRRQLNMIRPFYSWAYAAGHITAEQYMSMRNVKPPRGATGRSTPKPYKRTEVARFWQELDEQFPLLPATGTGSRAIDRYTRRIGLWRPVRRHAMRLQLEAMVRLALDCGLRRIEIFRLSVDDLHYDNEYLVVWRAKKLGDEALVKQMVPFTKSSRAAVYAWLKFRDEVLRPDHNRPWVSCWGSAPATPMAFQRFEELPSKIGTGWNWHRFRHTCATEWLRAGMPLASVSKLLGHVQLQQTLAYAEILEQDIQKQVDRHEAAFEQEVGRAA